METRTLTGPGMPDEESAKAAMNGTIEGLGKDGAYEVVSLEAREVDGLWVATLIVHILDPEPEVDDEDGGSAKGDTDQREMSAKGDDLFVLMHGHLGKNELMEESPAKAIPDFETEVPGLIEPPDASTILYSDIEGQGQDVTRAAATEEPMDEIAAAAQESVESLTEEFQEAETGALDYALAATQSQKLDELQQARVLSDEELLALAEEEGRQRAAAELTAAHAMEGPVPDPAQSA